MKLLGKKILNDFKRKHADAQSQIESWIAEIEEAEWNTPHDLKSKYPKASLIGNQQVVFDICGKKGDAGDLGNISITVRARAGSPNMDLNHTIIIISDGKQKALLTYYGHTDPYWFNSTVDADGDLFGTGNRTNGTYEQFGIIVLEDADNSCSRFTPVINTGDKVALSIRCSAVNSGCFGREIPERTDIFGEIIPEIGSPGVIAFTTPSSYNDDVFDLQ